MSVPSGSQPNKDDLLKISKYVFNFKDVYYTCLDKMRYKVDGFFRPNSSLVWNGNAISGQQEIRDFLLGLPVMSHVVKTFSVQPIVGGDSFTLGNMVNCVQVNVTGTVSFSQEPPRVFSDSIILFHETDNLYYILTSDYRLMN